MEHKKGVVSQKYGRFKSPQKWMLENNGKPYEQMDWMIWGFPIFLETPKHPYGNRHLGEFFSKLTPVI